MSIKNRVLSYYYCDDIEAQIVDIILRRIYIEVKDEQKRLLTAGKFNPDDFTSDSIKAITPQSIAMYVGRVRNDLEYVDWKGIEEKLNNHSYLQAMRDGIKESINKRSDKD